MLIQAAESWLCRHFCIWIKQYPKEFCGVWGRLVKENISQVRMTVDKGTIPVQRLQYLQFFPFLFNLAKQRNMFIFSVLEKKKTKPLQYFCSPAPNIS